MNKKDLVADIKRETGKTFITRKELASYLNLKDPKSVDRYINGLPCLNKRYFIDDIASTMLEQLDYKGCDAR